MVSLGAYVLQIWKYLFFRREKLYDLINSVLEEEDDVEALYIEPPEPNIESDEDSGDEDRGGVIDNLTARQLTAAAELVIRKKDEDKDYVEEDGAGEEKLEEKRKYASKVQSQEKIEFSDWRKGDIELDKMVFPDGDHSAYKDLSAVELFEKFFDDELLDYLVEETTKYSQFKNFPDPKISVDEMRCFFGILILSGYNHLPSQRHFWDSGNDMRNNLVCRAMRRDRFLQIKRFLHCEDNAKFDANNKMWKLQPLVNRLKKKFVEYFVPEENLSYDEAMIEYFGKHGCKQFIKGKPVRFGYKVWCLTTPSGYLVNFEIYQGKKEIKSSRENWEKLYGKCAAPLMEMIEELLEPDLPYHFFFDNLFTGLQLLYDLKERGYGGTGTMRENRLPKKKTIPAKNTLKNKEKGYFTSRVTNGGIVVCHWKDNNVVTVASNSVGVRPVERVFRYSAKEKKRLPIRRPKLVGVYNNYMGGVDRMDENISLYRVGVRGKKWWFPIFTWLLDTAIHNAWILKRKTEKSLPFLDFRREIAQKYLSCLSSIPKQGGRPSSQSQSDARIPNAIRFDRIDHFIGKTDENKRRRCAGKGCKSFGRTCCLKCKVGLCIDCFATFHNK